ncbi:MAG: succinate dehydrogenase/fumarate reductase flavoprotein subunit [Myxococcota bacterium]|jgi:succinate dehydrogenase/fumarate reductase flavoprotein subunit
MAPPADEAVLVAYPGGVEIIERDVVVVGGGGAGIVAACRAAASGAAVVVVSKEPIGVGDTKISTGIIARVAGPDSPAMFAGDVLRSGSGLSDPALVSVLAEGTDAAYRWLESAGLRASRLPDGSPRTLTAPMGGHSAARSIPHPARGLDVASALWSQADRSRLTVLDDAWCGEVVTDAGRVSGVVVYLAREGRWLGIRAGAVILATGGLGALYAPHSDTMRSSTGDGYALALRAGAALVDMEQVQFTPFGLVRPARFLGLPLGEPILAGPAGLLLDGEGNLLAEGIATWSRARVAGVAAAAISVGQGTDAGGVLLDLRESRKDAVFMARMEADFGHVLARVRSAMGPAAARMEVPWEVAPTAHYHMGGVVVDAWGESRIPGLFAIGQCAGGIHGANRLGSTSLPTLVVFGLRAAESAARSGYRPGGFVPEPLPCAGPPKTHALTQRLNAGAWRGLGPARSAVGIAAVLADIGEIRAQIAGVGERRSRRWDVGLMQRMELESLLAVAEAVGRSALARSASLGAHFRLDSTGTGGPPPIRVQRIAGAVVVDRVV